MLAPSDGLERFQKLQNGDRREIRERVRHRIRDHKIRTVFDEAAELAAYLDEQYVEMRIATPDGKRVTVVCNRDSILKIERHIRDLAAECPQIGTW